MSEGGLGAPTRHAVAWREAEFTDQGKIDAELRRVFDICHGCRRCFNLCDSFPRLFDLIDESESGELDSVDSADFKPVIDACTLCDMCFMTKCPYVPPHEFDLDFPHLMVRYRAAEFERGEVDFKDRQLTKTDRNAKLAGPVAGLANWAARRSNRGARRVMEAGFGIHREAELPQYHSENFVRSAARGAPEINRDAPAYGRKAVLYATCFVNYNNPSIGQAARTVLARNGVETEVVHPACCGMPQLEHGDLAQVAENARSVAGALKPWIDKGFDVLALVPSCALMLKFEWPLILPEVEDIKRLGEATSDICEYIVDIAKNEGLADGLAPLDGGVAFHFACHARAQNMGPKAAEMLKLIPQAEVEVIERCSGHGGSWGVMKENFEVALKVGKPAARRAAEAKARYLVSECPLARDHLAQGMEKLGETREMGPEPLSHPVQLLARAYGLD